MTLRSMMAAVFDFDVPCHILVKRPPPEESEDLAEEGTERTPQVQRERSLLTTDWSESTGSSRRVQ